MMKTTNCSECDLDLLSAALDGELSEEERTWFDAHLAICPECREEYLEMGNASKLCASLPETALPAGLLQDIRGKLVQEKKPVRSSSVGDRLSLRWFFSTPARVSFATCLGVFILALALTVGSSPQQTPPIIGFTLVAEAQDEIGGMDLVFDFDSQSLTLEKVNLGSIDQGFLMESKTAGGVLRVSLASARGIRLTGSESILEVPVQFNGTSASSKDPFRLLEARAYRPDGSRVEVNLKTIPMSPGGIGGKDTAA